VWLASAKDRDNVHTALRAHSCEEPSQRQDQSVVGRELTEAASSFAGRQSSRGICERASQHSDNRGAYASAARFDSLTKGSGARIVVCFARALNDNLRAV